MKSTYALLGLLLLPFSAYSVSFDCEKATTLPEKLAKKCVQQMQLG